MNGSCAPASLLSDELLGADYAGVRADGRNLVAPQQLSAGPADALATQMLCYRGVPTRRSLGVQPASARERERGGSVQFSVRGDGGAALPLVGGGRSAAGEGSAAPALECRRSVSWDGNAKEEAASSCSPSSGQCQVHPSLIQAPLPAPCRLGHLQLSLQPLPTSGQTTAQSPVRPLRGRG